MATNISELRKRAKAPVKAEGGGKTLADFFEVNKEAIKSALPKHISPDRMLKVALQAVRTTPQLKECTVESLFGAVVQCSTLGLEPNSVLGHAYLIPFRNNRRNITEVQMIPGYRGLIDLARRSGQIKSISARAVYEEDEFTPRFGTEDSLEHEPYLGGDRGAIIAFYAVAQLKDGGYQFELMSRHEVDQIKENSQGYRYAKRKNKPHPWIDHYEAMGRKTVIRRLAKYLPLSVELATATTLDGMAEGGQSQGLGQVLDGQYTLVGDGEDAPEPTGNFDEEEDETSPSPAAVEGGNKAQDAPERHWPEQFEDAETGEIGWQDSAGDFFEPDKHAWSRENKEPSVNADGTFRARPGSRKQSDDGDQGSAQQDWEKGLE